MSKRRISNGVGRYVPHPPSPHIGGHYELEQVPLPPEVVRIVEEQPVYGFDPRNPRRKMVVDVEIRERFEVMCACVHCKEDLHFAFPIASVSERFPDEVVRAANDAAKRVIAATQMQFFAAGRASLSKQTEAAVMWLASLEEFHADR